MTQAYNQMSKQSNTEVAPLNKKRRKKRKTELYQALPCASTAAALLTGVRHGLQRRAVYDLAHPLLSNQPLTHVRVCVRERGEAGVRKGVTSVSIAMEACKRRSKGECARVRERRS